MNKLFRIFIHIFVGFANIFIGLVFFKYVSELFGITSFIVFFLGFYWYEHNEDGHLKDGAYIDICGHLVGLFISACIILLLGVYNVKCV